MNFLVRLHGMVQLFLIRADTELQLYISPVNWRPDNPPVPISSPASFSSQINDRLGFFRTLGWAEATWPLNEDRLDEKAFMDDLYRAFDDRAQVVLHRLDARKWDLLVGVSESTDRVQHMMWRFIDKTHPMYNEADAAKYGDSILRVYRRVDQFVGEVLEHLPPDTQVLVMSDHGFHSFRHAVNLNTWLVNEGFLAIKGQRTAMKGMNEMFLGSGQFWENVDWSRTKAYAMGLGQVFINLKGREGDGAVDPAEYQAVVDDLASRLMGLTDPRNGARIVEQRLQARRDLQRPVPEGRARPPGGHGRRLSRVLADHARRVAAGRDRLSQHAQVERRSLRVRLQDDPGAPHLEPQARGGRTRASSTSARPCSSTSACPSRRRWTANPSSDADARDPPRVRPPRALLPVAEPGAEGLRGGRRGGRPGRGTRRGQPAQDAASAEAMASRAAARIKALQREADDLASRERTLLEDLRKLEVERDLRAEAFTASALDLQRIEREIDDTAIRIATLERTAESQLPDLAARMVQLYKVGNGGYLRLLMSVDDLREMGRAYRFVSGLQGARPPPRRRAPAHAGGPAQGAGGAARAGGARPAWRRRPSPARATRRRRPSRPTRISSAGSTRGAISPRSSWASWRPRASGCSAPSTAPRRTGLARPDWRPACRCARSRACSTGRWRAPSPAASAGRSTGSSTRRSCRTACGSRAEASTPVMAVHEGTIAYATAFTGFGNLVIVDHGDRGVLALRLPGRHRRRLRASASRRASGWAAWACPSTASPRSTSNCGSTVSRSIHYNG